SLPVPRETQTFQIVERESFETLKLVPSGFGQKLVLFNDGRDGEFAVCSSVFHPHHAAFALHSDAFRERDLGRQSQREANGRSLGHGGLKIETDAARAHVAKLRGPRSVVRIDADRYAERKSSCTPLFLLGLSHCILQAAGKLAFER